MLIGRLSILLSFYRPLHIISLLVFIIDLVSLPSFSSSVLVLIENLSWLTILFLIISYVYISFNLSLFLAFKLPFLLGFIYSLVLYPLLFLLSLFIILYLVFMLISFPISLCWLANSFSPLCLSCLFVCYRACCF